MRPIRQSAAGSYGSQDVILTIGTVRYIEFCKQNNIKTCRISGDGVIELARMDMNAVGIDTLTFIDYNLPEKDVEFAVQTGRAVMLRNVRDGMEPRDGMRISTNSARLLKHRRVILELLLASHNCNCTTCEKSGHCRLALRARLSEVA